MSLEYSEEMLSAYLDGESTPAETALIERLLKEDAAIQEQLAEFTDVGRLLRDIPRTPAPAGLADEILAKIATSTPSGEVIPKTVAQSGSRGGIRIWLSTVIAASVLGMASLLILRQDHVATDAKSVATLAESSEPPMTYEILDTGADAWKSGLVAFSRQDDLGATGSASSLPENQQLPTIVSLGRDEIVQQLRLLGDPPQSGDEYSLLANFDDVPILVDFTVIDVQKSLGELQVLLKHHNVEQVHLKDRSGKELQAPDQGIVAVRLDLAEPQLEQFLCAVPALDATLFVSAGKPVSETDWISAVDDQKHTKADSAGLGGGSLSRARSNVEEILTEPQQSMASLNDGIEAKPTRPGETTHADVREQKFQFSLGRKSVLKQQTAAITATATPNASTLNYSMSGKEPQGLGLELSEDVVTPFELGRQPPSPSRPGVVKRNTPANRFAIPPATATPQLYELDNRQRRTLSATEEIVPDRTLLRQRAKPGSPADKDPAAPVDRVRAYLILREEQK